MSATKGATLCAVSTLSPEPDTALNLSQNAVNGVPSCANGRLNNHVLRDEYNFRGYVVSDCGGVSCIQNAHHFTNTTEDTCAAALQGGCDLDCGGLLAKCQNAVQQKTRGLSETDVERALTRIFSQRIETGEFDPVETVSYRQIGLEHFNTSAAQRLALDVARQSLVLMKNTAATLPLVAPSAASDSDGSGSSSLKVVAAGPGLSNDMLGDYHGTPPVRPFKIPVSIICALNQQSTASVHNNIYWGFLVT